MGKKKIIKIYSTPTCAYCKAAKAFFKEKGISFETIDVSSDQKVLEDMQKKFGVISVPVIEVGSEVVLGFNKEEIEKLIE